MPNISAIPRLSSGVGARWLPLVGPRLVIRTLRGSDAAALHRLRSDPAVARYQTWDAFSLPEAQGMITQMRGRRFGVSRSWHQLAIARRDDDLLIGDLAFRFPAGDRSQAEIGFNIGSGHWRQGYGREAVGRFADWLLFERSVGRIFAVTDERNHGCRKLLETCGFQAAAGGWRLVFFKGEWAGEMVYERQAQGAVQSAPQ